MLLTIELFEGWHFVVIAGKRDYLGFSTKDAAERRLEAIYVGWI